MQKSEIKALAFRVLWALPGFIGRMLVRVLIVVGIVPALLVVASVSAWKDRKRGSTWPQVWSGFASGWPDIWEGFKAGEL